MPSFVFRAKKWDGSEVRGTVEADSLHDAVVKLRAQRMVVVDVKPSTSGVGFSWSLTQRKFGNKELAAFCGQVEALISSGLPLVQAIASVADQTRGSRLGQALRRALRELESGKPFAVALREASPDFPQIMINMIAAGEAGGTLPSVLSSLNAYFTNEHNIGQKLSSALVYPAFVLMAAILIMMFSLVAVVPRFGDLFKQMGFKNVPPLTAMVLSLSRLVSGSRAAVLMVLVVAAALPLFMLREDQEALLKLASRVPVIRRVVRVRSLARTARTLGTLLNAGVPLPAALRAASSVGGDRGIEGTLVRAVEMVQDGSPLHKAIASGGTFPKMAVELVQVGEESGKLEEMLLRIADFYDREFATSLEKLTSLVQPVVILIIGALIGSVVLAIFMPMLNALSTMMG